MSVQGGPADKLATETVAARDARAVGHRWRIRLLNTPAVVGVAVVGYQEWGIAAWLVSDDFRASPTVPVPENVHTVAVYSERGMRIIAAAWLIYLVVDVVRSR